VPPGTVAGLLTAIAFAVTPAGPLRAGEYMTPGFLDKSSRPLRLAILPPHADFLKGQAVMTADLVKEAAALEAGSAKAIAAHLQEKGYAVRIVTADDLEKIPGLRERVTAFDHRYDEEWGRMARKPRQVRDARYSVGEGAAEICALLDVDGLALARVVAVGFSGGSQALTVILSLGTAVSIPYSSMALGVINGTSGRVEGYFFGMRNCLTRSLLNHPAEVMTKLAEWTLDDYPRIEQIEQVDEQTAAEPVEAVSKDDEKSIGDFEALLAARASPSATPAPSATPGPAAGPVPSPAPAAAPSGQPTPSPEATPAP
jgi:hypothetical protein